VRIREEAEKEAEKRENDLRLKNHKEALKRMLDIIEEDASALALKRRQTIHQDAYGENREAWDLEIIKYLKRRPRLTDDFCLTVVIKAIEKVAAAGQTEISSGKAKAPSQLKKSTASKPAGTSSTRPTEDPIEFEQMCAEVLEQAGWKTQLTAKTGDQGIDVIATKKRVKCVIQCKLYAKPVGNSAVQEIRAGRDHEQADYAAVVSTSGYTKSAYALANSTQVMLLDFSKLEELDAQIAAL
jgi:restriction system protein